MSTNLRGVHFVSVESSNTYLYIHVIMYACRAYTFEALLSGVLSAILKLSRTVYKETHSPSVFSNITILIRIKDAHCTTVHTHLRLATCTVLTSNTNTNTGTHILLRLVQQSNGTLPRGTAATPTYYSSIVGVYRPV